MTEPRAVTAFELPVTSAVRELEAVAARAWPAAEVALVDGWLLRATDGQFTARANSAVPLSEGALAVVSTQLDADAGVPSIVRTIDAWYRERGVPTLLSLPVPGTERLRRRLADHGWVGRGPTEVMVGAVDEVARECGPLTGLPVPRASDRLDRDWLQGYERGAEVTSPARHAVLEGGGARFGTLHLDGEVAAVIRMTVDGAWVGIAPVEVASRHRRRGLARHLLAWALRDAWERGARRVWLQVEVHNVAAVALYRRLGLATHHAYWYHRPSDPQEPT